MKSVYPPLAVELRDTFIHRLQNGTVVETLLVFEDSPRWTVLLLQKRLREVLGFHGLLLAACSLLLHPPRIVKTQQ